MTDNGKIIVTLEHASADCVRECANQSGWSYEKATEMLICAGYINFMRPKKQGTGMGADEPPKELAPERVHA